MVAQLTYVSAVDRRDAPEKAAVWVQEYTARLLERGVSSICIRRDPGSGLEAFIKVADAFLHRGFLPIIELHPGDPTPPIRNLSEVCCMGTLALTLQDGNPAFSPDQFLDILNGSGRFRLPIDIIFDPAGATALSDAFREFLPRLEFLVKKYSHVQVVKLISSATTEQGTLDLFTALLKACPKATPAVSSDIWLQSESASLIAHDLELLSMDLGRGESEVLDPLQSKAGSQGIKLLPRLPLNTSFYRKGWFAFEVGKVLDSWVDRKAFKYYSTRPTWLED